MAKQDLTIQSIIQAFELLGERIGGYDDIELLIVGGIAGKLGNYVRADRITGDCDVMIYEPPAMVGYVEQEAFLVGKELKLAEEWLNHCSHTFSHYLPDDWKERRKLWQSFGLLQVYFLGRYDFLVLKTLSGRAQDQQDLLDAKATRDEIARIRGHVKNLAKLDLIDKGRAADALGLLEGLEIFDDQPNI